MSRHQAMHRWHGRALVDTLANQGILIRSPSMGGVAEGAPGACQDVSEVVDAANTAGLTGRVARLMPLICIKRCSTPGRPDADAGDERAA